MTATYRGPKRHQAKAPLGLMALEPRWMFDGAAAAHAVPDIAARALIPVAPAPLEVQAANPAKDNGKTEVVFVDTSLSNWQALVAGVETANPGIAVDLIDGGQSGLAQIAAWATTHSGYDAIHILSQGSEGTVTIGTDVITESSLGNATTQAELAEIGSALKAWWRFGPLYVAVMASLPWRGQRA